MKILPRLFIVVVAGALALTALRWSTAPGRAAAEKAVPPPAAAERASDAPRTRAQVGRLPRANDVRPPTMDFEDGGSFTSLRGQLERAPFAPAVTEAQRRWAQELLERHAVSTLSFEVHCTATLCRAEAGFADYLAARNLGRVRVPEDLSFMSSTPYRRIDRAGLGMLLYWGVGGTDLVTLAAREN